jgi:hypothetical protein
MQTSPVERSSSTVHGHPALSHVPVSVEASVSVSGTTECVEVVWGSPERAGETEQARLRAEAEALHPTIVRDG